MFEAIFFVSGFLLGALILFLIMNNQKKSVQELAEELDRRTRDEKMHEVDTLIAQVKD